MYLLFFNNKILKTIQCIKFGYKSLTKNADEKKIFYKNPSREIPALPLDSRLPRRPTRCTSRARLTLLVGREIPALQCRHLTAKPNVTAKNEPSLAETTSLPTGPKSLPSLLPSLLKVHQMPEPAASY